MAMQHFLQDESFFHTLTKTPLLREKCITP